MGRGMLVLLWLFEDMVGMGVNLRTLEAGEGIEEEQFKTLAFDMERKILKD